MIIVLTAEQTIAHELQTINALLEAGLTLLHIRKYHFSEAEMGRYIEKIEMDYRKYLVLHSHHHLAKELGINRLHFNEKARQLHAQDQFDSSLTRSTSVHRMHDFNNLDKHWAYALLSPMFSSISKHNYGNENCLRDELPLRKNQQVKLIGLAGIHAENMHTLYQAGVDGVALLGAIWNEEQALINFKKCLEKDLLYSA